MGLTLSPAFGGVRVEPRDALTDDIRAAIRLHKADLLALLNKSGNDTDGESGDPGGSSHAWLLHFADRDPLEVPQFPGVSHANALAGYPDVVAGEPTPERCADCRHLRRPGLGNRYCGGGRDDLPHAYGPGHPLRRLPEDGGETCEKWEGRT